MPGSSSSSSLAAVPQGTLLAIPTGQDGACPAMLYRAEREKGIQRPLVLHLHAGAFVSAPPEGLSCVVRLLLNAGATVLSLQYPLAPEHPFPRAIEAGYAALAHLYRQRRTWSGSGARVFIAGEEAGGNIAAAIALMVRDRGEPPLAGQILFSPMLDVCVATASLRDAHAGPVGCRWADGWHQYLPRASDALHPYAAPGTAVRLAGLPPTLLVTAHDDPFRDETEAYAQRLLHEGVRTEQLLLPQPTDFPAAYMQTPACEAPWAPAVRQRVRRFLNGDTAAPTDSTMTPSIHTRRISR